MEYKKGTRYETGIQTCDKSDQVNESNAEVRKQPDKRDENTSALRRNQVRERIRDVR
jgi:hypothetical protein